MPDKMILALKQTVTQLRLPRGQMGLPCVPAYYLKQTAAGTENVARLRLRCSAHVRDDVFRGRAGNMVWPLMSLLQWKRCESQCQGQNRSRGHEQRSLGVMK